VKQSLLFTSGKGGVGTSNLVLNLAIALAEMGARVVVLDADIGLANLDLLCGLTLQYDLGDVLAGTCELGEALVNGPGEIRIVAGAHAVRTVEEELADATARLVAELDELESTVDFLLLDGGSGLSGRVAKLAEAACQVAIVSTPEPTSIADTHAAINRLRWLAARPRLRVLVNQAASEGEAELALDRLVASSRQFLGAVVSPLGPGSVRADPHVPIAVRCCRPFVTDFPGAAASRGVRRLARALIGEHNPPVLDRRRGLWTALAARWASSSPAKGRKSRVEEPVLTV
jgi:flagellar biosynthesis protein FlhG